MLNYTYYNANPKNRKTGDCSTRALVGVLGITYEQALREQMEESLRCYYDPTSKQVMERVLKRYGWIKMPQPKKADGTKYTVAELDKVVSTRSLENGVLVTVANHHLAVKGDSVLDTWDSRRKCIGNYYIRGMVFKKV